MILAKGGSVKIRSKDPFDRPVIDLNVFSHPFDLAAIKEGIRLAKRFYSGAAWDGYISSFNGPDPDTLSEAEFRTRVTQNALTFYHPVGTAKMSPKNAKHGVVDPELRLKGASGLRIIDSSVFVSRRPCLGGIKEWLMRAIASHTNSAYTGPCVYSC